MYLLRKILLNIICAPLPENNPRLLDLIFEFKFLINFHE